MTINHYVVIAIDQQSPGINKRLFICVLAVTNIQNALFCYRCSSLLPLVSKGTSSIHQRTFRGTELKPCRGSNQIVALRPQAIATNHKPLCPLWLAHVATCQEASEMVSTSSALLPASFCHMMLQKTSPHVTQQSCHQ